MTTILVIDDDPFIAEMVKALLPPGWRMLSALDGLDGLDLIRSSIAKGQPPDLVLLDIDMPHLDGFDTCILLRNIAPDLIVVPFTNLRDDPRVPKYMTELNCAPPIYKGVSPSALLQAIEAAMHASPPALARGAVFERLLEKAMEAEARARAARGTLVRVALYVPDRVERLGLQQLLTLAGDQGITTVSESREAALRTLLQTQPIQVLAAPIANYRVVHALSQEFRVPALSIARSLGRATALLAQMERNGARSGVVMLGDDFVATFTHAVQALIHGESFIDPLIRDLPRQLIEAALLKEPFGSLPPSLVTVLVLDQLGFEAELICDYLDIKPHSLKTYWNRIGEHAHLKRAELHAWARGRLAEHADLWQLCSPFVEDA